MTQAAGGVWLASPEHSGPNLNYSMLALTVSFLLFRGDTGHAGSWFPHQELSPLLWKRGVLPTGPPGFLSSPDFKSLSSYASIQIFMGQF